MCLSIFSRSILALYLKPVLCFGFTKLHSAVNHSSKTMRLCVLRVKKIMIAYLLEAGKLPSPCFNKEMLSRKSKYQNYRYVM